MSRFNASNRVTFPSRKLASDLAKTGATVLYEVPSGMSARIESLWICSVHTGSVALELNHTRPGESVGHSNSLLHDLSVASKATTVYDQPILMSAGDRIWILADSADKLCVTLYGVES